jgi:hypothetical protein
LPAGDYTFTLPSSNAPYTLYVRGQEVGTIIMAATANQGVVSERPQLNLVDTADGYAVQTFEAPELGVTFIYLAPTQKHLGRKEAPQKTVPQTASTSQVRENKTSIAVHTTGR